MQLTISLVTCTFSFLRQMSAPNEISLTKRLSRKAHTVFSSPSLTFCRLLPAKVKGLWETVSQRSWPSVHRLEVRDRGKERERESRGQQATSSSSCPKQAHSLALTALACFLLSCPLFLALQRTCAECDDTYPQKSTQYNTRLR